MRWWLALLILVAALPASAQSPAQSPDAELAKLLDQARASCNQPSSDRLVRILCSGHIRMGVRDYYPLFATHENNTRQGFEIDVADAIAAKLEVQVDFTRVNAANRIALLAEDRIDVTIATMGHNTQRDGQARFIRPHYYQSETALIGPKAVPIRHWADVAARTT